MYPNCRSQRLNSWRSNAIHPFTGIFCSLVLMFFLSALISGPLVAAEPEGNTILECGAFSTLEEASAQGWEQLSQRDEIRPEFFVSRKLSLPGGKGSLGIYGASSSLNRGCWSRLVDGIKEGCFYRFEAFYFARGVDCPHLKAFARLRWSSPEGDKPGWRDYVPELGKKGEWRKVGGVFRAPKGVDRVRVELFLSHSPQGTALWDEIRLAEVPALPKRPVRLATANCRPSDNSSSAESVEEFCRVVEQAGEQGCDIICLGEGINMIGVTVEGRNVKYPDIAEPVPGPTTERLGELARKYGMYIVACLGEREGMAIYNTAVLIDRKGEVTGKYRKVYLPEGEVDAGVQPGDHFPVFETDFGRIGMMICWDSWYPEAARALAFQGAEVVFLPIWGGSPTLTRARAFENHVYVVSSGYDIESNIYGPWGRLLAEAAPEERPGVVVADIDLNYPQACPYDWPLGNIRRIILHELRSDIRIPALER